MTGPALFAGPREQFEAITGWLGGPEAAGLTHAGLEDELATRGRELLRQLLQGHLDLRAAAEPRLAQVTGADQVPRARAEAGHSRALATVFGEVTVRRRAYRAPGAPNLHPADAALNLPPEKHSHGLRKLAAAESARGSYGQAAAAVSAITGTGLGKRQAEQLAGRAAADFAAFYAAARPAPGAAPGDVLVLSADGKGIMMRPGGLRPAAARAAARAAPRQQARLSRGQVGCRKRMAHVGAVYDAAPVPRTPASILPGTAPREPGTPDGPRATGKWLTASITSDAATGISRVFTEAARRDPRHQRTWIALVDGNPHQITRIRAEATARNTPVTIICDFIHVLEYLWRAAWSFHPEADPAAGHWVRRHARAILDGHATTIAASIRHQAATATLSHAKRATAATTADYLDRKAPYLDYPTALAAGWPIATGIIEGACRHLVKDRMDITGARWNPAGAEAILQLRTLHANGDFNQYWAYHLNQEHNRTHTTRYHNPATPRAA